MKIWVVDENDKVIGEAERESFDYKNDYYRVSALWVVNSKGEMLIAQRSWNKDSNPGKWGAAVSGTVEVGETYLENIMKETVEEIGLEGVEFEELCKAKKVVPRKLFATWYIARCDWPIEKFVKQDEEVEAIKWIEIGELVNDVSVNPDTYISGFGENIKPLIERMEGSGL
jgi:Isopentenyldiphosphate isomerase